jgi:XapX domain-containing protein
MQLKSMAELTASTLKWRDQYIIQHYALRAVATRTFPADARSGKLDRLLTKRHRPVLPWLSRRTSNSMKVLLISFSVGAFVGLLYGVIRVKSPAPPIIALLGLLGMVIGEQLGGWILTKKVSVAHAASVCLVSKHWNQQSSASSITPSTHNVD